MPLLSFSIPCRTFFFREKFFHGRFRFRTFLVTDLFLLVIFLLLLLLLSPCRDLPSLNADAVSFQPRQMHMSTESSDLLRRRAQRAAGGDLQLNMQHLATAVECARRAIESAGPNGLPAETKELSGLSSFDPAVRRPHNKSAFDFSKVQPAPSSPFLRVSPSPRGNHDNDFPWPSLALFGPNALNGSGRGLDGCLDELVRNELNFSDRLAKPFLSELHKEPSSPCPFRVHEQDSVWVDNTDTGYYSQPMSDRSYMEATRTHNNYHRSYHHHHHHHQGRIHHGVDDNEPHNQHMGGAFGQEGSSADALPSDDMQSKDQEQVERERKLYRMHQRLSRMWRHEQQALQWHWVASTYRQFATFLVAQQQQQHVLKQQQQQQQQQQAAHHHHHHIHNAPTWAAEQASSAEADVNGDAKPRTRRRYRRRRRRRNNKTGCDVTDGEDGSGESLNASGMATPEEADVPELSSYGGF